MRNIFLWIAKIQKKLLKLENGDCFLEDFWEGESDCLGICVRQRIR